MGKPTVAILGASADRRKFGNKSLRAHLRAGYDVYPVNPYADVVEGHPAYARLADVPVALDRISVYVPPQVGMTLLDEIAEAKAGEVYFNPGSKTPELLRQARARGINAIADCSIVALGLSPSQFSDG
jgi:predicted CoA-binding protein